MKDVEGGKEGRKERMMKRGGKEGRKKDAGGSKGKTKGS